MHANNKSRGFIALMSVIIISAILLIIIAQSSLTGMFARATVLDHEYKLRSAALADACVDIAQQRLATASSTYTGLETIVVAGGTCRLLGTTNGLGNPRIFQIQANFEHAYTNLLVSIDVNSLQIGSWQEVAHF